MSYKITGKDISKGFYSRAIRITLLLVILFLLGSCAHVPSTESWKKQYSHLQQPRPQNNTIIETDYYIVFLVAAYHLDYWDNNVSGSCLFASVSGAFKNSSLGPYGLGDYSQLGAY